MLWRTYSGQCSGSHGHFAVYLYYKRRSLASRLNLISFCQNGSVQIKETVALRGHIRCGIIAREEALVAHIFVKRYLAFCNSLFLSNSFSLSLSHLLCRRYFNCFVYPFIIYQNQDAFFLLLY